MENVKRIALWDNLKFLLITFVVIGHFAEAFCESSQVCRGIYVCIYAFHMPLFLFISGLFHSNRNITSKCLFFISVGFARKIMMVLVRLLVGKDPNFDLLADNGLPWFMFVLAIYTFVMYLLRNKNKTYLLVAGIILACFVGFDKSIGDYLYISRAIIFFPCYVLGTMINPNSLVNFKKRFRWLLPLSALVLVLWVFCCFAKTDAVYNLRPLFTGRNPFSLSIEAYGPLARLLCYFITAVTSFSMIILVPSSHIPMVSRMGTHSLDVYFWHGLILVLLNNFAHLGDLFVSFSGKILYFVIAILLSVILSQGGFISYPLNKLKQLCYYDIRKAKTKDRAV